MENPFKENDWIFNPDNHLRGKVLGVVGKAVIWEYNGEVQTSNASRMISAGWKVVEEKPGPCEYYYISDGGEILKADPNLVREEVTNYRIWMGNYFRTSREAVNHFQNQTTGVVVTASKE